jgi:hypothetical protein
MADPTAVETPVPRWLHIVMKSDRAGSAAYVGLGFFFAPVLAVLSPWPAVTAAMWVIIGLAGLWLGLLGVAMATGLAMVLRSGAQVPDDYWRSITGARSSTPSARPGTWPDLPARRRRRSSRHASA